MQRVNSEKKTFIALIDADGCFYNQMVDVSLRYLIADHHAVIDEIAADPSIVARRLNQIDRMLGSVFENIAVFAIQLVAMGKIMMRGDVHAKMLDKCEYDKSHSDVNRHVSEIKLNYIRKMNQVDEL